MTHRGEASSRRMKVNQFSLRELFAERTIKGRIVRGIPYIIGARVFPCCAISFFDERVSNHHIETVRPSTPQRPRIE